MSWKLEKLCKHVFGGKAENHFCFAINVTLLKLTNFEEISFRNAARNFNPFYLPLNMTVSAPETYLVFRQVDKDLRRSRRYEGSYPLWNATF